MIQDNGTRMSYPGGGTREAREGKGREDLIEPELIFRLGAWYELGAKKKKYGDRNLPKGKGKKVYRPKIVSPAMSACVKYRLANLMKTWRL